MTRDRSSGSGGGNRHIGLWLAWWVAFLVAWVLLTWTLDPHEVVAGVVCAAAAATVAEIVRVQDYRRFQPDPAWFLRAPRLLWRVVTDSVIVLAALGAHLAGRRRINGAFRAIGFDAGGEDGRSSARRAVVVTAISMTPNTYVVGIDEEQETILVHQLVPVAHEDAREDVLGKL